LLKSEIILLDVLHTTGFMRPVYYASTVGDHIYLGLNEHLQLEGLASRIVPYTMDNSDNPNVDGFICTDLMIKHIQESFHFPLKGSWTNYHNADDTENKLAVSIALCYINLADKLFEENRKGESLAMINRMLDEFPTEEFPCIDNRIMWQAIQLLYKTGEVERAWYYTKKSFTATQEIMKAYTRSDTHKKDQLIYSVSLEARIQDRLLEVSETYIGNNKELQNMIKEKDEWLRLLGIE
jgi:hypothetical protein